MPKTILLIMAGITHSSTNLPLYFCSLAAYGAELPAAYSRSRWESACVRKMFSDLIQTSGPCCAIAFSQETAMRAAFVGRHSRQTPRCVFAVKQERKEVHVLFHFSIGKAAGGRSVPARRRDAQLCRAASPGADQHVVQHSAAQDHQRQSRQ